jgi:hypothetical protein
MTQKTNGNKIIAGLREALRFERAEAGDRRIGLRHQALDFANRWSGTADEIVARAAIYERFLVGQARRRR